MGKQGREEAEPCDIASKAQSHRRNGWAGFRGGQRPASRATWRPWIAPNLIVAHDVANVGSDRAQLTAMSWKARQASGCEEVTVLADRGYYCNGDVVLACEGTGILPVIPKTQTSGNPKRGLCGLYLRNRERSLHLPRRRAPDQGKGALRPPG